MPNTLVVSTFGCPFSEFEAMILMSCSDLEKFGSMLEQPELKQWDIDNNCVDTVYNLELIE